MLFLKNINNLILIAGGISKKEDYSEFFKLINEKVNAVILIGECSSDFSKQITAPHVEVVESMKKAVRWLLQWQKVAQYCFHLGVQALICLVILMNEERFLSASFLKKLNRFIQSLFHLM